MYFIRRIQNYGIFSTLFFQAMMSQVQLFTRERGSFLKVCRHIKSYSALLRHIHAYSGIFSTPCNSRIFKTILLLKTLSNVDQAYSEPCHRALFSDIQNRVQRLHMQKLGKLGILENLELFHSCIPRDIQNPVM